MIYHKVGIFLFKKSKKI